MSKSISIEITLVIFYMFSISILTAQKEYEYERFPMVLNSEIKKYNLTLGQHDHQFILNDKEVWSAAISIPELKENEKTPLVIALHWGGPGDGYKGYSECLAFPAFESMNAIIIAPSSDGMRWTSPKNEDRVIDLVKKVIKYWPVDPEKVIVTGYSNGGIGSWHYAKKYPKLFAANIPLAGYYKNEKINVPVYAIHGEKDELFDINEIKEMIEYSIKKGSKIKFKIIPGYSHYDACAYLEALLEMVNLVEKEVFLK
jgi:predicted peptidase